MAGELRQIWFMGEVSPPTVLLRRPAADSPEVCGQWSLGFQHLVNEEEGTFPRFHYGDRASGGLVARHELSALSAVRSLSHGRDFFFTHLHMIDVTGIYFFFFCFSFYVP